MPRAQKGQRFGGRVKGTPNKSTVAKAIAVAEAHSASTRRGLKPGLEILADFANLFAQMAATYQPLPPSQATPEGLQQAMASGREPNEEKFRFYATLAATFAHKLAEFQAPKLARMQVIPPPPVPLEPPGDRLVKQAGNIYTVEDPNAALRAYQALIGQVKG